MRGFLVMMVYVTVLFLLYFPQFSDQHFIQALFPIPFPNGTITYYDFISFFGWIVGLPIVLWMAIVKPIGDASKNARRGLHR
jgi:hypothetical protein